MTDCNPEPLNFSTLGRETVVADFCGGRLTSDSGALLLREVADRLGLFDALDAAIPDPRHPVYIVHDQEAMLAQRIMAIALGYEDLNDHQTLRADPALQLASGMVPEGDLTLASPPTLCRLENRIDREALARIAAALVDTFIAAHPEPPEHLSLDFDATDDPTHGEQEGRFFHGYYGHHCFLPLIRLLRRRAARGLPPPQRHRRAQARPRRAQAAGPSAPRRVARGQDHDPGR